MPQVRMNCLKSLAMNCGLLSEMMQRALHPADEDFTKFFA
jgi:hypothetical protein